MKLEYLQIFPFYGQIVDKSSPLKWFPVTIFITTMSLKSYTLHFMKEYMRRKNTDKAVEVHPDTTFIMTYSHAAWL